MRNFLKTLWLIISAPFRFIFWFLGIIFRGLRSIIRQTRELLFEEPDDAPLDMVMQKAIENPMGVLDHFVDLRTGLLRATIVLIITSAISFTFSQQIMDWLAVPIGGLLELESRELTENLSNFMRVSLLSGFALSFPYIIFELWLFVAPGVSVRARWFGFLSIPLVTLFFIAGAIFTYYVPLPPTVFFLKEFLGIPNVPTPTSYFSIVTRLMFWMGLAFQFPLIIYVVARMGLVDARQLAGASRIAVVITAVLAAAITPTTDPMNMLIIMVPLIVLYFIGVGLAFVAQRGRLKEERQKT